MRILIFNWRDISHPDAGGAEVYIHEISKRLSRRHDITLFCGEYKGCNKEDIIDGIKIIRKGTKYSVYLYAPIIYMTKLKDYDMIIDCENGIPFFTPFFSRKPKICVMHHIHDEIFKKELAFPLSLLGYYLEIILMPLIYKNTQFIAVSQSTRKQMEGIGIDEEKIHIVYNGMSEQFYPDWSKKKDKLIVYMGRIKKYKQLDHLLKAFKIVKNIIKDSELIIAGKGDCSELKNLSEELDLDLTFIQSIDEEEKIHLLQEASVYVTPSMKEGWGITVIEANRCGTPAIAYDVPGLRNSIKDKETGLLISPGNIEELANGIINIINNNDFNIQLRINALKWSQEFDWNKSAERFEDILQRLH